MRRLEKRGAVPSLLIALLAIFSSHRWEGVKGVYPPARLQRIYERYIRLRVLLSLKMRYNFGFWQNSYWVISAASFFQKIENRNFFFSYFSIWHKFLSVFIIFAFLKKSGNAHWCIELVFYALWGLPTAENVPFSILFYRTGTDNRKAIRNEQ